MAVLDNAVWSGASGYAGGGSATISGSGNEAGYAGDDADRSAMPGKAGPDCGIAGTRAAGLHVGELTCPGPGLPLPVRALKRSGAAAGRLPGRVIRPDGPASSVGEIENIICFTPGARILTSHGERAVEALQVGDRVVTRDNGLRPIRWIGRRRVKAMGNSAPIRIAPCVTGAGREALLVSPEHRVLFTGYRAELLFGESEVLVAARHLVDGKDVTVAEQEDVTYIHIMLDRHEVIYASGIATESFHAGDMGLGAVSEAAREELFALFPELRSAGGRHRETARPCLRKHEALLLMEAVRDG